MWFIFCIIICVGTLFCNCSNTLLKPDESTSTKKPTAPEVIDYPESKEIYYEDFELPDHQETTNSKSRSHVYIGKIIKRPNMNDGLESTRQLLEAKGFSQKHIQFNTGDITVCDLNGGNSQTFLVSSNSSVMYLLETSCITPLETNATTKDSLVKLLRQMHESDGDDVEELQVNLIWVHNSTDNFAPEETGSKVIYLNEITYFKRSYCVFDKTELPESLPVLMCSPGCSALNPCHKKCCGFQDSLSLTNGNIDCVSTDSIHSKFLSSWLSKASGLPQAPKLLNFQLYDFSGDCGSYPDNVIYDFRVSVDGTVEFQYSYETFIPLRNYCVDELLDENGTHSKLAVLMCYSDIVKYTWTAKVLQLMYSTISFLFLGISVAVYFVIRDDHSIHGWTQFAFLVSAFLFYVMRSAEAAWDLYNLSRKETTYMNEMALVDNFFVFGLLLNVINMNVQLFWTFLKLRPEEKVKDPEDFKRFSISLVAIWSCSAFLTSITFITYYSAEEGVEQMEVSCKLYILIVVILCAVTLVVASGTICVLCKKFKERASIQSTRRSNTTKVPSLVLRFFCITGLVWTLEILELLVKKELFARGWIWDTIQFLIHINGVGLFIVFVCNKKILNSLQKKFPSSRIRGANDENNPTQGTANQITGAD